MKIIHGLKNQKQNVNEINNTLRISKMKIHIKIALKTMFDFTKKWPNNKKQSTMCSGRKWNKHVLIS